MIREAFKFAFDADMHPVIRRVEINDPEGQSWREAKKALRKHFLERAAALRKVTQKEYFNA